MDMNLSKLWKIVKDEEASHAAVHGLQRAGHNLVTEHHHQLQSPSSVRGII